MHTAVVVFLPPHALEKVMQQTVEALPTFYSEREQAALAWTEAVTVITADHVPDAVYEATRQRFTEKECADLTLAIATINS